ncbi:molybdopterin-guanine dinucleotide biosynthesis protein B [Sinobacterium caligoides]|uniref:Molybdopterin-guanine dinucleotide biosynthesis protein B n=1 Tax=Sinobacterium caligoides TaxID=933926 RepID=A0A3N2DPS2_9GAMM|nr:molybdopterin-guanine dinucleotide biosynthesis protein B [Sinobacterium caligoides]ROS01824.1 molybdopterin-guanine dinucleotide biosynthesis protein B [Sinobacterium caligoides]
MKTIGIIGWKNSGKTTLVCKLVSDIKARGLSVSTIKHTHHHDVEIDQPGKDSYLHRKAGANEVILATHKGWMIFHEQENEPELDEVIERISPVDVLLVEGYKLHHHPKILVFRPDMQKELLAGKINNIIAVASDQPIENCPVPVLDLNNATQIADFLLAADL